MKDLNNVKWEVLIHFYDQNDRNQGAITLSEYIAFQEFFRLNFKRVDERLHEKRSMTKKSLKKFILRHNAKTHHVITDNQLDILMTILDRNSI